MTFTRPGRPKQIDHICQRQLCMNTWRGKNGGKSSFFCHLSPFLTSSISPFSRLRLASPQRSLSNLDLPGRAVLHRLHHAPVRHLSGSIRRHPQPHRAQPLQLQNQSHDEDRRRLDHIYRSERCDWFNCMHASTQARFKNLYGVKSADS